MASGEGGCGSRGALVGVVNLCFFLVVVVAKVAAVVVRADASIPERCLPPQQVEQGLPGNCHYAPSSGSLAAYKVVAQEEAVVLGVGGVGDSRGWWVW